MEHHADKGVYPPIQVHVTLGNEDLTVKVNYFLIDVQACKDKLIVSRRHSSFSRKKASFR
jgi:hypothetical protein